jgi:predicted transcriptional regulator
MRKSKLELYEEVLSALVDRYLSIEGLAIECNTDCATAAKRLDFLEKNRLVEEYFDTAKVFYSLTPRGKEVYKALTLTKRLGKLRESIEIINERARYALVF